jgi:hypothetical protein
VTDEHFDGTDRTDEFLGKRQRLTPQTGNALLQGVVEPLDVVGLRANLLIAWCLRWSSMANWRIVVPGAVLTSRPSGELGLGSHCPNGNGHTWIEERARIGTIATTLDVQWFFLLLFVTGLAAGLVNAITGGGGLVVLPVFLAAGLVMALGQVIGGVLGAHLVVHKGAGFVRPLYLIVVIALLLKLLYERITGMG